MLRALVVYKKSAYQLYVVERRDTHLVRLLRQGHPDTRDIQQAHDVHQKTLDHVLQTLKMLHVPYRVVYRGHLRASTSQRSDLVISVGGDGTLLQAAHALRDTPILGVNSDRQRSEAVFCAATRHTFARIIRAALAGTLTERLLYRLHVRLNGRIVGPLVLNDVLIAHQDPATMSRYRIKIGASQEAQKSSGLWVATAAGSSSAILAAGGRPVTWSAKRFQYRPRELYRGRLSRYRLTGGVLEMGQTVEVRWLMREGAVFVDGPHVRLPVRFGDWVVVALSPHHPLRILGVRGPQ